jgi:hypothetical protein
MMNYQRKRFVEFKASYISQWQEQNELWPEIIFPGERGTPRGMAQLTPYAGGYFQLHGMTKDITLFDDGLVQSTDKSAHPELGRQYVQKLEQHWSDEESLSRSKAAIDFVGQYMPDFKEATAISTPLYGAQQIPGEDETLRAAEVSFEKERYARCEIVKASSVLTMARRIHEELINLNLASDSEVVFHTSESINTQEEENILQMAQSLWTMRQYPSKMAELTVA